MTNPFPAGSPADGHPSAGAPRFTRLLLVVAAVALAVACSSDTSSSSASATSAPTTAAMTTTTRAPLTQSEHEACAEWAALKADKTASERDIYVRVLTKVQNRAWVDAEGGRVHRAAHAVVEAFDAYARGGPKEAIGDASAQLTDACS